MNRQDLAERTDTRTRPQGHERRRPAVRLHVVFNNETADRQLNASWGFACLVTGRARTVLFDTGSDGSILTGNLERMGLDAGAVDHVVLSHEHWDHVDGLAAIARANPGVVVHPLGSFSGEFHAGLRELGLASEPVDGPVEIADGVFTTGEVTSEVPEQALVVETDAGLVVITGCAHPDVAAMAEQAHRQRQQPIHLVMGGFHLRDHDAPAIEAVIGLLEDLGVQRVAPSHCTGDQASARFREHWGARYLDGRLGAVISVGDRAAAGD